MIEFGLRQYGTVGLTGSALAKVDTPLSERYLVRCQACGWEKQFFGTADEARQSALKMGWEFRVDRVPNLRAFDLPTVPMAVERAICPHCKLLVPV